MGRRPPVARTKARRYFSFPLPLPLPALLERLLKSESFLSDAHNVAAIPDDTFSRALESVERAEGFVGWQRLQDVVQRHIEDQAQAQSLVAFIMNFDELRRDLDVSPQDLALEAARKLPDALGEEERKRLLERLVRATAPKKGLERQAKAEAVVRRTGGHLDELSLISDLRPIFDDSREKIEGLVPMTTLKLIVHRADAIDVVEVSITEEELNQMAGQVEQAKRKLDALKSFIKGSPNIELPESIMTLTEPREA